MKKTLPVPAPEIGMTLYTKSKSFLSWGIRAREGQSCSHTAGVRYDRNLDQYMVSEMMPEGLRSTAWEKWVKKEWKYVAHTVCLQNDLEGEAEKVNRYISQRVNEAPEYAYGGILGFFGKFFKRLNTSKSDICSELWTRAYQKAGLFGGYITPELTSPQDLLKLCESYIDKFIVRSRS